jgi:[protein-PII] uridylyltransferase
LADCGVDVLNARIATVSEQADDVFFVTDLEQRPITDQDRQGAIREAIEQALQAQA